MSPALPPVKPKVLIKIFESWGFVVARQKGSHISMTKPGVKRPLIVAAHGNREIDSSVYMNNVKTAGKTRDEFLTAYKKFK